MKSIKTAQGVLAGRLMQPLPYSRLLMYVAGAMVLGWLLLDGLRLNAVFN